MSVTPRRVRRAVALLAAAFSVIAGTVAPPQPQARAQEEAVAVETRVSHLLVVAQQVRMGP